MQKQMVIQKRYGYFYSLLFLACSYFLLPSIVHAATHNLDTSSEWNIRIDGEQANDALGEWNTSYGDVNHDGVDDLLVTVKSPSGYLGRTNINITYVIYSTLLDTLHGKGNIIDLADSSNYNLKIVAAASGEYSPYYSVFVVDLDNNGRNDLVIYEGYANNGGTTAAGAVYIIYDTKLDAYSGTGNIIDLANPLKFDVKIIGTAANDHLGYSGSPMFDFNGDGKKDLLLVADNASSTNGLNAGSAYIIYNDLLATFTGVINISDSSKYNIKIDGPGGTLIESYIAGNASDVNSDGVDDVIIYSPSSNNNGIPASGSAYILYSTLLAPYAGTGNLIDLANSSKYNVRIDGVATNGFGWGITQVTDINGNGKSDLILNAEDAGYNGRVESGSVFILLDSLLNNYATGTGQSINLTDSTKFSMRFDGPVGRIAHANFGTDVHTQDTNSDGKPDLIADSWYFPGVYTIDNSIFGSVTGTGTLFDMASSTSYSTLYINNLGIANTFTPVDLNLDGATDQIFIASAENNNGRLLSGSVYIVYNFPHSISITPLTLSNGLTTATIHGSIDASASSTTNIAGVQYNIDSNDPAGAGWTACTADDAAFNSTVESFTCVPSFSSSAHTIYIRAYDTDYSYTPLASYATVSVNTSIPGSFLISDTPNQPLALTINGGSTQTNSHVVDLNLTAGSNVVNMALSRTADFLNISQEPYQHTRSWDLCSPMQTVCAPGTYSVYVKYYTFKGARNEPIQATIEYVPGVVSSSPIAPSPAIVILKFLRNLTVGSRGNDVKQLQIFLNSHNFPVAKKGAGSPGKETTYFGAATRTALIKYQRAFLKEILGPNAKVSQASGVFGPSTMKWVNGLEGGG